MLCHILCNTSHLLCLSLFVWLEIPARSQQLDGKLCIMSEEEKCGGGEKEKRRETNSLSEVAACADIQSGPKSKFPSPKHCCETFGHYIVFVLVLRLSWNFFRFPEFRMEAVIERFRRLHPDVAQVIYSFKSLTLFPFFFTFFEALTEYAVTCSPWHLHFTKYVCAKYYFSIPGHLVFWQGRIKKHLNTNTYPPVHLLCIVLHKDNFCCKKRLFTYLCSTSNGAKMHINKYWRMLLSLKTFLVSLGHVE